MNREKTILPEFLIADLYRHSIMLAEDEISGLAAAATDASATVAAEAMAETIVNQSQPLTQEVSDTVATPAPKPKPKPAPIAPPTTAKPAATATSPTPAPVADQPGKQWYLGNNLKHIALIVSEPEAAYLQDESLKFLTAILGACKLNLGDVSIVNQHHTQVDYASLKQQLAPKTLILFGVSAQQLSLPFTIPHYQVQSYDQCTLLLAPALNNMLGDSQEAKLEKSKLWICLKKIFQL